MSEIWKVTEDEVELVATEIAKAGGVSWYREPKGGPLKAIADRYRDRARIIIAALDRHRASKQRAVPPDSTEGEQQEPSTNVNLLTDDTRLVGRTVLYRPPGDRRAYRCRVEMIDGSRAYLVPDNSVGPGWVNLEDLSSAAALDKIN